MLRKEIDNGHLVSGDVCGYQETLKSCFVYQLPSRFHVVKMTNMCRMRPNELCNFSNWAFPVYCAAPYKDEDGGYCRTAIC